MSDAEFQSDADVILAKLHGGPYARIGASGWLGINLPWTADLNNPVLTSSPSSQLSAVLTRAQARGLAIHLGTDAGVSRALWMYDPARREDRRNAEWYQDGTLQKTSAQGANEIWMTPSRYARKLRRHLETKVRAFARIVIDMRQQFPDTLVSVSGDGEMELNYGGLDASQPLENQQIADYSPFAVAEFRDWIRHTGLYGPGQPYDGQGFTGGGARYQGAGGLSAFNTDYSTFFTSWNLQYFDWDVATDPVDGDLKAIPDTTYQGTGWNPMPLSGPDFVAGGFDAPRSSGTSSAPFWQLWLRFRETMISNYQKDFATWMTTTADAGGNRFEASRWYSHQLPADYVGGTYPNCPNPNPRLRTSASPMWTADTAPAGSVGLTAFDVYWGNGVYTRTSQYLLPELKARGTANWGFVEWNPSWPLGASDPDVAGIAANTKRAFDAGAHVLNYLFWDFFIRTEIPQALDLFLSQVKNQPRDAGTVTYAPPSVSGVTGKWFSTTISLSWSDQVFPGVSGFSFSNWTPFARFEVWRGASATFGVSDGTKVADAATATLAGIVPDASKPFYRVRAVTNTGTAGAFSDAVSPTPPLGGYFYTLAPCRVLDTRNLGAPPLGGPSLAASSRRTVALTGLCGIPAGARAISVNVTVVNPGAPGFVRFFPGDTAPTPTAIVTFLPHQVRANNAILPLSEAGLLTAENGSAASVEIVVDVNGYYFR